MNAEEKRKVFEELLEGYQDYIESEFSYEDGEREAERKAWLNKYDGIKEPLIKDEKIRKAVRAWAEACGVNRVVNGEYDNELCAKGQQFYGAKIVLTKTVALPRGRNYTIAELCGEEEE